MKRAHQGEFLDGSQARSYLQYNFFTSRVEMKSAHLFSFDEIVEHLYLYLYLSPAHVPHKLDLVSVQVDPSPCTHLFRMRLSYLLFIKETFMNIFNK